MKATVGRCPITGAPPVSQSTISRLQNAPSKTEAARVIVSFGRSSRHYSEAGQAGEFVAPRAYWKGYLKLSLVPCPIARFPATSERDKICFHQLNKNTGHRIKYRKVDADTGDEVEADDIIKGYEEVRNEAD